MSNTNYEEKISKEYKDQGKGPEKLDISFLKYFWESSYLYKGKKDTISRFLRRIDVLKSFSDNELWQLSKFLHLREFSNKELIFKQRSIGFGFYFIFSGQVDIIVERDKEESGPLGESEADLIITLDKGDYFGELALLQEKSFRNATAVSREYCTLLGIFKPDIEEMINFNPVLASKLLQSISLIVANRLISITKEVKRLKSKVAKLEKIRTK